jgi:hypothetical protein
MVTATTNQNRFDKNAVGTIIANLCAANQGWASTRRLYLSTSTRRQYVINVINVDNVDNVDTTSTISTMSEIVICNVRLCMT